MQRIKKTPIPVEGIQAEIEKPGPVTTWAEMSPEKRAEIKALYEGRAPKAQIGLKTKQDQNKKGKKRLRLKKRHKGPYAYLLNNSVGADFL